MTRPPTLWDRFVAQRYVALGVAIAGTVGLILLSRWVAGHVRHVSGNVDVDAGLIGLWLTTAGGVAYLQALIVRDLFFRGQWSRSSTTRGERALARAEGRESGPNVAVTDDDLVVMQRSLYVDWQVHFSLMLFALLALHTWGLSELSGGFFGYYFRGGGFYYTQSRAADAATRVEGIQGGYATAPPGYSERMVEMLSDPSAEVRGWAAWAVGEKRYAPGAAALVERLRNDPDPTVRAAAVVALARLGRREIGPEIVTRLRAETAAEARRPYIVALGYLQDPRGVDALLEIVVGEGEDAPAAAWALALIQAPTATPTLVTLLRDGKADAVRCAAVEALRAIGDASATSGLQDAFDAVEGEAFCDAVSMPNRIGAPITVVVAERYDLKILRAIAQMGEPKLLPWLRTVAADGARVDAVRSAAAQLIEALGGRL